MNDYIYPIRFVDKYLSDWFFILHTTEAKTDKEIEDLIAYWAEENREVFDDYSPVSIMDSIVESNPGWSWEDGGEDIVINFW